MPQIELSALLIPALLFIGLGLLAGLLLTIFSKVFAVRTDERVEEIIAVLPGLNCGACGYSGCEGYAKQIVNGGEATNRCIPGGDAVSRKISAALGSAFEDVTECTAFVACGGKVPKSTKDSYIYQGEPTCAACNLYYQGKGVCDFGCIGYGDCIKQCAYDAISIVDEVAVVDPLRCTGCGMCTRACPKDIIHIRDAAKRVYVACSSCNNGKTTVKTCENGCIACGKCVKICPHDAIYLKDNCAVIDYDKCTACMKCVEVCPRRCIDRADATVDSADAGRKFA